MEQKDSIDAYIQGQQSESVSPSDFISKSVDTATYYGDALNDHNVNEIIGDEMPHVVILVGFPKYGKSTFVASLYHKVLTMGKIGRYLFIDSETIAGFERRAQVRKIELKIKERIDRTPVYADYFLSLLFEHEETSKRVKLVLSDRSGENYRDYATSESIINEDMALRHAAHIVFFLDATKIASSDFFDTQNDLNQLTTRMKKYGAFEGDKIVDIVFNKIDKLLSSDDENYKKNKEQIERQIGKKVVINKTFEINSLKVVDNEDLNTFFKYLLEVSPDERPIETEFINKLDWVRNKFYNK